MRARTLALALLMIFSLCVQALAWDTVQVTPTVTARETYDSNVNFMGKSDMEHSVSPGVRVEMQRERASGALEARGSAYKYNRLDEFDRIDQNYDAVFQFNATERVTMDFKGAIVADHAFTSSLAETGQLSKTASHQVYSAQPSITFSLNEINTITLLYGFAKTVYDTKDYTDSVSNTVGLVWGRMLNERLQLIVQAMDTRMDTDIASFNSLSFMGGFEYSLAEKLKARVLVGASTIHSRYDTGLTRSGSDFSADTSLDWEYEQLHTTLGFTRDITLGVSGEDLVRDKLALNFYYRTTEKLTLSTGANLTRSKSSTSSQSSQDNSWLEIQPGARYQLGEKTFAALNYAYGASKDEVKDELKTRSRVSLEFKTSF